MPPCSLVQLAQCKRRKRRVGELVSRRRNGASRAAEMASGHCAQLSLGVGPTRSIGRFESLQQSGFFVSAQIAVSLTLSLEVSLEIWQLEARHAPLCIEKYMRNADSLPHESMKTPLNCFLCPTARPIWAYLGTSASGGFVGASCLRPFLPFCPRLLHSLLRASQSASQWASPKEQSAARRRPLLCHFFATSVPAIGRQIGPHTAPRAAYKRNSPD